MKKLLILLCSIFFYITTNATTYYVATTGSNSNTGTSTSPWLNLSYACSRITTSGDIIHINAGTYNESTISNLAVGVSIEGDNKSTTIIRSNLTSVGSYTILLSSSLSNTNGNQHISNLTLRSTTSYAAYAAIGVLKRGNVEIYNCDIIDFNYYAVAFHNGEQTGVYAVGNKIHDCIIKDCGGYIGIYGSGGDAAGALSILSQDGLQIYNNTITIARPNGMNGNCIDGVEGFIKNMKVYNNILSKTLVVGTTPWDFAIEIWNWEGGNEIYNNVITGSVDVQYAIKGTSTYSAWIHDNIIGQSILKQQQSVRGVLLEIWNSDVIIERNYIHHVAQGVFMRTHGTTVCTQNNITVRYNVFDNIGAASGTISPSGWGFYCSQEDLSNDNLNNFKFYNNTVIASTSGVTTSWGVSIPDLGKAINVTINNNIIKGFAGAPIRGNGWNQGTSVNGLAIFNNIFYNNGNNNDPNLTATGFTATNVTGLSPQTNLKTDPQFINNLTDYHLTTARVGLYITSGLTDKDGVTVANPPTIGAYEFKSIISPIPISNIIVNGTNGITTITTKGGTLQMIASILPVTATNQTITWSIINGTGTASINATGLLTSITNGTVIVKATANDGSNISGTLTIAISNQIILVNNIIITSTTGETTITTKGGTLQMIASILPVTATNQTITWSVINGTGTATIAPNGILTALTNGTITVNALANDNSGINNTLVITISNQNPVIILITNISIIGLTIIDINKGTLQLNTSILPINASNSSITWSVIFGTGTATISTTGILTALTNGTVTVKAISNDGSNVYGTLIVTISNQIILVNSVLIVGETFINVNKGTLQLNTSILPINATNKNITWSIINGTGTANINSLGILTALTNGTVTVKAISNDGSNVYGTLIVTISNQIILVTNINVSGYNNINNISINRGVLQMIASVLPDNATNKNVLWSVNNNSGTSTISSTGLLTASTNGYVTVKASAVDGSNIFGIIIIFISNQSISAVLVYPNPTKGTFTISIQDPNIVPTNLKISNLTGNIILKQNYAIGETIKVIKFPTHIKTGMYFLFLESSGTIIYSMKIIVIK